MGIIISCGTHSESQPEDSQPLSARQTKIDSIESLRYVNHGKTLIQQHEYLDAYAAFTTAIQTFGRNAEAYRCRAWVDHTYLHPGQETAGQGDWELARTFEPGNTPLLLTDWQP